VLRVRHLWPLLEAFGDLVKLSMLSEQHGPNPPEDVRAQCREQELANEHRSTELANITADHDEGLPHDGSVDGDGDRNTGERSFISILRCL
jgi:hypothetical protein